MHDAGGYFPFKEAQKKPGLFQERIRHSIKVSSQLLLFAVLPGNCVRCLKYLLQRLLTRQLKGETLPQCTANLCWLIEQYIGTSLLQRGWIIPVEVFMAVGSSERLPCELVFLCTRWSWKKKHRYVLVEKQYTRDIIDRLIWRLGDSIIHSDEKGILLSDTEKNLLLSVSWQKREIQGEALLHGKWRMLL